ncbi:MAG: hypothetical protein H7Y88_09425 [Phycisphaerales bacterium]|nr:hypothetical protein [Phycisphaerales bacterium]
MAGSGLVVDCSARSPIPVAAAILVAAIVTIPAPIVVAPTTPVDTAALIVRAPGELALFISRLQAGRALTAAHPVIMRQVRGVAAIDAALSDVPLPHATWSGAPLPGPVLHSAPLPTTA